MPPKKASAVIKEKKKTIDDKTFGMKNKTKSKTVQKKIKGIATAVMGDPRKLAKEEELKNQRKLQKLAEKEREKELKSLFNVIPGSAEQKKLEDEAAALAENAALEEKTEEEQQEEALTMLAQIEEEMKEEEEMTLEEIIDKERAKIMNGTPVTMESFKQWKEFRLKQQQKENELLRQEQEVLWKKSGSGITGRLLFEVDRSVFVDDENADEKVERVEVDESLFLDEETENLESLDTGLSAEEAGEGEASASGESQAEEQYDPETWKESQPPKSLLQEWITRRKIKELPKYEALPVSGTGSMCKIVLTHLGNKEFLNTQIYNNKKLAENNVALMALRFLQSQEPAEQE